MNSMVSLMLATYNRLELTKRMLASLFKNTTGDYRLIIVDNGSTDGTQDYLLDLKKSCDIFSDLQLNEKNQGIAIGRNQALKLANKYNDPYLSTLDNDIEVIPNWLNKCLSFLFVNPKFMIGLNMEGVQYPVLTRNEEKFQYKRFGNLGTACTVFPRELHTKIGYFPTEFGLYGEEDAQYGMRARIVGYEMAYLVEPGVHFGEGENDTGEYREFKTLSHKKNLAPFQKSCADFVSGKRSVYIDFD